jgi:hypothetical protein
LSCHRQVIGKQTFRRQPVGATGSFRPAQQSIFRKPAKKDLCVKTQFELLGLAQAKIVTAMSRDCHLLSSNELNARFHGTLNRSAALALGFHRMPLSFRNEYLFAGKSWQRVFGSARSGLDQMHS